MDPNQIVGTPRDFWVWLAPDWSDYREGEAKPANSNGWTRVKIRETLFANGRIVRNVLDANGAPVASDGTPATGGKSARELDPTPQYDKDQQQRWKDQQAQAQRGDQEGDTRGPQNGPNREVFRGGKWVLEPNPLYQANAGTGVTGDNPRVPAGSIPRIEGTPIPGQPGQYDNTQPIRVWHTPDGKIIYEALTPQEVQQWEIQQNQAAGRGAYTNAQVQQQQQGASKRAPDPKHPGYSYVTTVKGGVEESHYEKDDNPGVKVPPPPDAPNDTPTVVTVNGQTYIRHSIPGVNGQPAQVYHTDQNGNRVTLPTDEKNAPLPAGAPRFSPDQNADDLGLVAYNDQLIKAEQAGIITRAQAAQLLDEAGNIAKVADSARTARRNQANTTRSQDISQRGQTLGEVQSRRTFQGSGFDQLFGDFNQNARYLGRDGGDIAARAFASALGSRQQDAANAGGFQDVPEVGPISPYMESVRQSTQITAHPDGNLTVSPPGTMPPGSAPPTLASPEGQALLATNEANRQYYEATHGTPTAPPAVQGTPSPLGDTGAPPVSMGRPAYLQGAREPAPQWSPEPTIARLKQQGFTEDEIRDALEMHQQEYGAVA